MRVELLASLLLAAAACQQGATAPTPPVERSASEGLSPIDLDALVADAPGYVANRYDAADLPDALVRDLAAAGFTCQAGATAAATDCTRAIAAFASCFDIWSVRITADHLAHAEVNRRCMGAMPPPSQP